MPGTMCQTRRSRKQAFFEIIFGAARLLEAQRVPCPRVNLDERGVLPSVLTAVAGVRSYTKFLTRNSRVRGRAFTVHWNRSLTRSSGVERVRRRRRGVSRESLRFGGLGKEIRRAGSSIKVERRGLFRARG